MPNNKYNLTDIDTLQEIMVAVETIFRHYNLSEGDIITVLAHLQHSLVHKSARTEIKHHCNGE